jgi:hypothetical protein
MDYGSHLKKLYRNPSRASARYAKQSKFEGSLRQMRGAILRIISIGPKNETAIRSLIRARPTFLDHEVIPEMGSVLVVNKRIEDTSKITLDASKFDEALAGLRRDGMVGKRKGKWGII